jgi:hypothetical protein
VADRGALQLALGRHDSCGFIASYWVNIRQACATGALQYFPTLEESTQCLKKSDVPPFNLCTAAIIVFDKHAI